MSIRLKLIITYAVLVFISAGILVFSGVSIITRAFSAASELILESSDMGQVVYEIIDISAELKQVEDYNQEKLKSPLFMKEIDDRVSFFNSGLVVLSDGIYENPGELPHDVEFYRNLVPNNSRDFVGSLMGIRHKDMHLKENHSIEYNGRTYFYIDFTFHVNDEPIVYFFVTDVTELKKTGINIGRGFVFMLIVILIIIMLPLIYIITKDIIKPLNKLERGVKNITDGNLDFKLSTKKRNELGRVVLSFETMRQELKKSIDKQVRYEENRKELISSISHDLKTPMTSIKGYVEGIIDGVANTPEKLDKYLHVIHHKSEDMDRLIDDLFLFSKLDLNREIFNITEVNIHDFVEDAVQEIKLEWEADDTIIKYENLISHGSKGKTYVNIDQQKIKRVIMNIVQNSMKYMDKDHREVKIILRDKKDTILLSIEDNGRGIEEEHLERIFEKFYRIDQSRNTKAGGTGLGLAIAKQIIESHGGSLVATSEMGIGTTMTIELEKVMDNE